MVLKHLSPGIADSDAPDLDRLAAGHDPLNGCARKAGKNQLGHQGAAETVRHQQVFGAAVAVATEELKGTALLGGQAQLGHLPRIADALIWGNWGATVDVTANAIAASGFKPAFRQSLIEPPILIFMNSTLPNSFSMSALRG